jgi:hypothetical protein
MARNWHQIVLVCIRRKSGSEIGEHTRGPSTGIDEKAHEKKTNKN